jgi:hypothetical protein
MVAACPKLNPWGSARRYFPMHDGPEALQARDQVSRARLLQGPPPSRGVVVPVSSGYEGRLVFLGGLAEDFLNSTGLRQVQTTTVV